MADYKGRSGKYELLDGDDIPFADIRLNMQELDFINTHLGGHHITLAGFHKLSAGLASVSVCEIGCGGGDNLRVLSNWCRKNKLDANFTGVDINDNCIRYAKEKCTGENYSFISSDYRFAGFEQKPDIIFSSLFCHHFTERQLVEMMLWMKENCTVGFFINDLHRHPLAYHFISFATKLFSKSYLVKNDAPLSVLRGFKKAEWVKIMELAGINGYSIHWKWAFRYLITCLV